MVVRNVTLPACVASVLLACTTRLEPEPVGTTPISIPPPEISIELPLEQRMPRDPGIAQACLLSATKSCMELDARAFEPCLVGADSCDEKGEGGIMPLGQPVEKAVINVIELKPR